MSFLPFVLSFLLILVLGSSVLLTSFRSTSVQKTAILGLKNAQLGLISKQARREFEKTWKKDPTGKEKKESESKKQQLFVESRNIRSNMSDAKFNLWPLLHEKDSEIAKLLYEKAVKLVENLYRETDFYKAAKDPDLARQIVDQMRGREATSLLELFPQDEKLAGIYYKMVKGTNTGYPPLEEFFKIDNTGGKGLIQFRYASTPVLQAIFGDELTYRILAAERAKWDVNPRKKILTKDELQKLIQNQKSRVFDVNQLESIFSFGQAQDVPHAHVDKDLKVMAIR